MFGERVLAMDISEELHPLEHCCQTMTGQVNQICKLHPKDLFSCGDRFVYYSEQFDEYGLVFHDGTPSYLLIYYCPWCGKELPDSKRDLWFEKLNKLGFEDPFQNPKQLPQEFLSSKWYKKNSQGK